MDGIQHRHGSAYDRGRADSYYRRGPRPHYFKAGSYTSEEVLAKDMTPEEIQAYYKGYEDNEREGEFKDYR